MDDKEPLNSYPPMMTVEQVAEYINISVDRLNSWRRLNRGPQYVKMGDGPNGAIRYPREALRLYVRKNTVTPAATR